MSYTDDFFKELNKKNKKNKKEENDTTKNKTKSNSGYANKFYSALNDDIAPLPSTATRYSELAPTVVVPAGGEKDSWFKTGGFSDGVDGVGDFFGDLGETVAGTVGDLSLGMVKGVGRTVEGIVDLGTYAVGGVGGLLGFDDFKEKAKKVAQYNATDEWTKPATDFLDQYSVLGNKADMVSEGLGQVATILLTAGVGAAAGLSSAGVTALTTGITGLSSMGTGIGNAYSEDANDTEAFLYGLGAGAIEAGTELLSGGLGKAVKALGISRGIGGLDDIFAKKLSSTIVKSISNESVQKILGNTIEAGVKAGGEGLEEVLSGLGSAVMKWLTYEKDEDIKKLIEDEDLLEQFVVGAITSSIAQGADYVKANKSGRDFVTGYTNNEQAVIDKEVEKRVSEKEKNGKKLTNKEIVAIEEQVRNDMEHGQLNIETIEEVLGGEKYTAYKDTVKNEEALKAEYDRLANIKKSDLTTKQEKRLAELEAMNLEDTTKRNSLRKELNDTVFPQLNDSKLAESYKEIERQDQKFEVDLTKYKGKQREAVERAVKSGVLNNTYRSHVLVDTLSRIEADKGITFDYTNNKKLKESGFAVEGVRVNGYANKSTGSVTLNVQSQKAWQSVVGHEITHILKDTKHYTALKDALFAYAESKGDLANRRTELTELYQNMDTDVDEELTADLVGDYLFTDKAFIDRLTGNRTLFQKVYDEIKYLWSVATGKEKADIEKVKREFDQAWKEVSAKGVNEESGKVQYSVSADNDDIRFSLSKEGEQYAPVGDYSTPFNELAYDEDIAPVEAVTSAKEAAKPVTNTDEGYPDNIAPMTEEEANSLAKDYLNSLTEEDAPPEMPEPYYGEEDAPVDLFEDRDIIAVGRRSVKAYMYENPEVKPFFQAEANIMLGDLARTTRGERVVDAQVLYDTNGENGVYGLKRYTSPEIAYLKDEFGYTYDEIKAGLKAIIEDDGAENNACSKRIEFMLNDRLMNGYRDFVDGIEIPANQEYIRLVREKGINEYNEEARKHFFENADSYAPPAEEDIAPVMGEKTAPAADDIAPSLENIPVLPDEELDSGTHAAIKPQPNKQTANQNNEPKLKRRSGAENNQSETIAKVLVEEPEVEKKKKGIFSKFFANFIDKGAEIENLSLKTKNRALQDKYKTISRSETKANYLMEHGTEGVKSLDEIRAEVEKTGKVQDFYDYMYHMHNIDRMSLESKELPNLQRLTGEMAELKLLDLKENQLRAIASEKITKETSPKRANIIKTVREYLASKDVKNKPVYGYPVTAEISQDMANKLEAENPEFKKYAQDVYDYMNYLRKMMVDNGIISEDTAKLWAEMYPHYVPIRREGKDGYAIDVPLDTYKTGINAPIKGATGGNSNILPLFNTIAQRTMQTFKAVDKNRFGIELKNTLGGVVESTKTNLDEVIDSIDAHESLLQEGKNGKNPTFTVFENGNRVTFDITEEIYDALKPTSKGLSYTNKALNTVSNLHRGVITEYNPVFMATNAIKDAQDVLINSQHPAKTYANFPVAIKELTTKGKWYTEYMENGGGDNTYFDKQTNTFKKEKSALRKIVGFPLDKISEANNFIEKVPRLAEYIASREGGASVDAAMLDAARVTTDFSAGGDVTKFFNRNGVSFLNASVQGFAQQIRNVREAKMNGLKGWLGLAAKCAIAGLPAALLNKLLWDDDEEYAELSDYVKENYYVVAKYGDGNFVRIPKGRTLAVIQNGFEQIGNALTGDDEVDFNRFFELFISNLAPNNPLDNNIIAPIIQAAENKTWYGEDLVPKRLQDLPAGEQYDESTDSISKWLGENLNISPYKINYLLNQYSGGVGDVLMPMLTPEAESGDNSFVGNLIAPMRDKFTTDSIMNNQNISDFYDKMDELTTNAKSSAATDEDILKYKYFNSVNKELGELYGSKREIQNAPYSDDIKYNEIRDVQKQIVSTAREALSGYNDVVIDGDYAVVGDRYYHKDKNGEWEKISDNQLEKQKKVNEALGISGSEYWSNKSEYDYAYKNPDKYAVAKAVGGYSAYKTYSSELNDIKSDKDENGKSISGSRKEKVIDYINNLDADYYTKIILFKSEYPSDDTYNADIVNYVINSDFTYDEKASILTELGFRVTADGEIYAD